MRCQPWLVLFVTLAGKLPVWADSARPAGKETYWSANRQFQLTVDPRWTTDYSRNDPLLTLTESSGTVVWSRGPEDFESFGYPMHVCVSTDGQFMVFGGYSAHNISWDREYREGLRFYDREGELIRFISRRDLPVGEYSVSTAHWYDPERTKIEGGRLIFYTPGKEEPMEFEISTGRTLEGILTPGQGDDENWRAKFLRRSDSRAKDRGSSP